MSFTDVFESGRDFSIWLFPFGQEVIEFQKSKLNFLKIENRNEIFEIQSPCEQNRKGPMEKTRPHSRGQNIFTIGSTFASDIVSYLQYRKVRVWKISSSIAILIKISAVHYSNFVYVSVRNYLKYLSFLRFDKFYGRSNIWKSFRSPSLLFIPFGKNNSWR